MKSASVVNVDMGNVASVDVDSSASMHTKQLAEHWKVTPRALTDWIAKVRKLGYEIGQQGERNRTYFNDVDQDLIKAARYNTLTQNPNPKTSQNDSENVLRMQDRKFREVQEASEEATQNRNLELQVELKQGSSVGLANRKQASYQEGAAIAKAEFAAMVLGYTETKIAARKAFNEYLQEVDDVDQIDELPVFEGAPTPKQLLAGLF
jgi:hypothetical protein